MIDIIMNSGVVSNVFIMDKTILICNNFNYLSIQYNYIIIFNV